MRTLANTLRTKVSQAPSPKQSAVLKKTDRCSGAQSEYVVCRLMRGLNTQELPRWSEVCDRRSHTLSIVRPRRISCAASCGNVVRSISPRRQNASLRVWPRHRPGLGRSLASGCASVLSVVGWRRPCAGINTSARELFALRRRGRAAYPTDFHMDWLRLIRVLMQYVAPGL